MLTGAALGVLGTLLQAFIGWGERKQTNQATERELQLQLQIQQAELEVIKVKVQADKEIEVVKADGETSVAQITSDAAMYRESQSSDKASYGERAIDFIRGTVRPVITYLCVLALLYTVQRYMTEDLAKQLLPAMATMLVDLTATVVVWWFGGRFIKRG